MLRENGNQLFFGDLFKSLIHGSITSFVRRMTMNYNPANHFCESDKLESESDRLDESLRLSAGKKYDHVWGSHLPGLSFAWLLDEDLETLYNYTCMGPLEEKKQANESEKVRCYLI